MEIERKFLVKDLPNLDNYPSKDIVQSYISFDPEIRIRKIDDCYYLTNKSSGTLIREENEIKINLTTYLNFCRIIRGNIIHKTRYFIPIANNLKAHLDIYHDDLAGLQTIEVEFSNLNQAQDFIIPNWFFQEITEDIRIKT